MNAVAMLKRCSKHQGGEDAPVMAGYGNDGSYQPPPAESLSPSDQGVVGWRALPYEQGAV